MATTPVLPEGHEEFLALLKSRKEWQVQQYDGTGQTTDDISPMARAVATGPVRCEIVAIAPEIDRDSGLAAATTMVKALDPEWITFVADAHVTPTEINPATGERWKPGEMQRACDHEGACEVGVLDDALAITTVWRSGRIRMETLVYTVTKGQGAGSSTIRWSGHHEHPPMDTGDTGIKVASGYIPEVLAESWSADKSRDLLHTVAAVLQLDPTDVARLTISGFIGALNSRGYAVLATTTDDRLRDRLQAAAQDKEEDE